MNSNGMPFGKTIASHLYVRRENSPIQWIKHLWNGLVPDWMQFVNKQNKGGSFEEEGQNLLLTKITEETKCNLALSLIQSDVHPTQRFLLHKRSLQTTMLKGVSLRDHE